MSKVLFCFIIVTTFLVTSQSAVMEKKEVLYPIGNATAIVEFSGSKSDTRVRKFWERVERGHWERSTLHVFHTVIDKETSVIDFGAWIGPTILFAGNFAKQVLGLEPNSRAYKVARRNVELNSLRFGKEKVQIKNQCISTVKEKVDMKMGPVSADDSMASVLRIRNDTSSKKTQWNPVECDTLQATIQNFVPDSSNPKTKVFVKVDIEGFEAELVESWRPWLKTIQPTIFLSMHQQLRDFTDKQRQDIKETLKLFPYIMIIPDCGQKTGANGHLGDRCDDMYKVVDINDEFELCKTCDYLLSYQNFEVKEKGQGQERVQVKEQVQVQDKDNGATKTQTKELTKEQAKEKQRH